MNWFNVTFTVMKQEINIIWYAVCKSTDKKNDELICLSVQFTIDLRATR